MAGSENRYAKTRKGVELLEKRSTELPRKVRSALLLVFASKTEAQLREQGEAIGAPPDFLERLLEAGLIERAGAGPGAAAPRMPGTAAERFIAATRLMEQSAANEAGMKAFFFQLKVQKCANVADVEALLPAYREFIEKHAGPETARLYARELDAILRAPPA